MENQTVNSGDQPTIQPNQSNYDACYKPLPSYTTQTLPNANGNCTLYKISQLALCNSSSTFKQHIPNMLNSYSQATIGFNAIHHPSTFKHIPNMLNSQPGNPSLNVISNATISPTYTYYAYMQGFITHCVKYNIEKELYPSAYTVSGIKYINSFLVWSLLM